MTDVPFCSVVLVVSEVCARGCGAGRAREGSAKGAEGVVARPTAYSPPGTGESASGGPKTVSLSLVDIFNVVARTKGSAEGFAQSHPQHGEAVSKFIQDLHQISLGLQPASRVEQLSKA
jgi:hypothetical protein